MPKNQFQRIVFAFITVIITVHAFVFYNVYVLNGSALMQSTGADSVIGALKTQGGVYMFGNIVPIWFMIIVEFACAYFLECIIGSPASFKLACKNFDMKETNPTIFEIAIICSTVMIMCPLMSLLASIFYYPYDSAFSIFTLLANWLKMVCFNFPFALLSQIFFIQPIVRTVFKLLFVRKEVLNKSPQINTVIADNNIEY